VCFYTGLCRIISLLHTRLFYGSLDFVRDNLGESLPEETFTHSHLSWSSVSYYLLPPSIMIHGIPPVQFTCLTVIFHYLQDFFGLPLGLAPSTSYSIHFFAQSLSFFAAHAHLIVTCFAVVPRLCQLILVSHITVTL